MVATLSDIKAMSLQQNMPRQVAAAYYCTSIITADKPELMNDNTSGSLAVCWNVGSVLISVTFGLNTNKVCYGIITVGGSKEEPTSVSGALARLYALFKRNGVKLNTALSYVAENAIDGMLDAMYSCSFTMFAHALAGQLTEAMLAQLVYIDGIARSPSEINTYPLGSNQTVFERTFGNPNQYARITNQELLLCTGPNRVYKLSINTAIAEVVTLMYREGLPTRFDPDVSVDSAQSTSFFESNAAPADSTPVAGVLPTQPSAPTAKTYKVRITTTYTRDVELIASTQQELGLQALELTKTHPEQLGGGFTKNGTTIKRIG